jgi:hypothetical protein
MFISKLGDRKTQMKLWVSVIASTQ